MNKKTKTAFVCTQCGQDYTKWQGKCHNCGTWDSVVEFRGGAGPRALSGSRKTGRAQVVDLASCEIDSVKRYCSSSGEVDRVLGGGVVPGGLVLIGGDPGIGKSTLLLQLMGGWAAQGMQVLYVSGEESSEQVSMRAHRVGLGRGGLKFLAETSIETICASLDEYKPRIVAIDSIQTMMCEEIQSAPGGVAQVREATAALLRYAKARGTAVFIVGHVTKDGALAGPRLLEHMVDTVLYFEGDSNYQYRILRSIKNRYGPSGEIAVLSMTDRGLEDVRDSAELFLQSGSQPQTGTAVVPVREGSRVLVVEVQALVNHTHFGLPQRVAAGINPRKLSLLVAVLERYGGVSLGEHDIFFNVAGGLAITEPAVDLSVIAALVSSFRGAPVRKGTAFLGEVGLGGELRPVNGMDVRIRELAHLGFERCVVPVLRGTSDRIRPNGSFSLITCSNISEINQMLYGA